MGKMETPLEITIGEKRSVMRGHAEALHEIYGVIWIVRPVNARSRLELVAKAGWHVARMQELEGELAQLLARQDEIERPVGAQTS